VNQWIRSLRTALLIGALALYAAHSAADDLEDSLEAELDAVAEQEANDMENNKSVEADEIVVDEGEEEEPAEQVVEEKPTPAPAPAEEIANELAEKPEEKASSTADAEKDIVDEELSLDEEDTGNQVVAEPAPVQEELEPTEVEETTAPVVAEVTPKATVLFDEPNLEFEKRLHRIVQSYDVFSQRDWDELLGSRTPETYPVQPGDTLWDISRTFFGDGFFWARLWSQNGVIDNPHKISKGKAIRFIEGTEADAPSIGITETAVLASNGGAISVNALGETQNAAPTYREEVEDDITPEEMESGIVLETEELIPAPELPPPSKRTPLLKNLPYSFKEVRPSTEAGYDASGFKNVPSRKANEAPVITLNSFVVDRTPATIGVVDELEAGDKIASVGQYMILKMKEPVKVGEIVTIIDIGARIPSSPGPTIYVQGTAKITGVISNKNNIYRALVTSALSTIDVGSSVIADAPPKVKVSRQGRRSETVVSVIGGEFDQNRKILGSGAVIYLNGGAAAGLKVGDILGIQSSGEERKRSRYPGATRAVGLIRVADVQGKVATAIVLESNEEIVVGDRTGGEFPEPKPALQID